MRWIIIILLGASLMSCTDQKNYSKDYKTRKIVDSLFKKESIELNKTLADQCSIRTVKLLDNLVDSILVVRRLEVEDILRRETLENAE